MGHKPYTQEETKHHGQNVVRNYDGAGKNFRTDIWEKNSAGSTTKEGHRVVIDGKTYDHYGKKI
jgi:hypothetical protein